MKITGWIHVVVGVCVAACAQDEQSSSQTIHISRAGSGGAAGSSEGSSGGSNPKGNAGTYSAGTSGNYMGFSGQAGSNGTNQSGFAGAPVGGNAGSGGTSNVNGAGGDSGAGGSAPCPDDMVWVGEFCMDRYEAPNLVGALPLAMQTAYDGEDFCQARGKQLCTESEWVQACQGSQGFKYPYGNTWESGACNDDKVWKSPDWGALATYPSATGVKEAERLYQADPSGSRMACISEDGVADLTGNVAEWVVRSFPHANNYDHVMKGCYWSKCYGGSNPDCSFVNPAHPGGFRTYEAGFRCCKPMNVEMLSLWIHGESLFCINFV
jgi:formylglycine-generating enzyme